MTTPMPDYGLTFNSEDDNNSDSKVIELLKAEEYANQFILKTTLSPSFNPDPKKAQLWGIDKDSKFYLINEHEDVYQLLGQSSILSDSHNTIAALVYTSGWAAPLSDSGEIEGPPSKHDLRRRIHIASCITWQSVGSALYFVDSQEIVLDSGSASGTLAEAIDSFWKNYKYNGVF